MNIGVFDSGLGGLMILKAIRKKLPEYNYIYLGDNARVPYGNRSPEIIYQFTKEAIDFLAKKNCRLIIIACNTSTATSLKRIQKEYIPNNYPNLKVLGVIKPVIEELDETVYGQAKMIKIGVIGTKATVNSQAFVREINKILPKAKIYQQACPLLVPYIEDSMRNKKILGLLLNQYLGALLKKDIDYLLLACTHYEMIKKEIKKFVGKKIKVISEGKIVADKLKNYLLRHQEIESNLKKERKVEYCFTDPGSDYKNLMKLFLK